MITLKFKIGDSTYTLTVEGSAENVFNKCQSVYQLIFALWNIVLMRNQREEIKISNANNQDAFQANIMDRREKALRQEMDSYGIEYDTDLLNLGDSPVQTSTN